MATGRMQQAEAPLIVLSNSLLTDLRMCDSTITLLTIEFPGYRLLRYNTRGHESNGHVKVTIDVLADDLAHLLD